MEVMQINETNFEEMIKSGDRVVVDCFATWCGPCKMLSPVIDELAGETEAVKFFKLDIDENDAVVDKYKIMAVPTLLFFENGNLVSQSSGFKSKDELKGMLSL